MNNKISIEDYSVNAVVRFMKCFVNEKAFREFAQKYKKARVYAADFLIEADRETYSNICRKVHEKNIDVFFVIVCLSTIYDDRFEDFWDFYQIKKEDLVKLLKIQEEDMDGESLVYAKNIELIDFWDMIIFDDTYSWAYTMTHEDDLDGSRICFTQEGPIRDNGETGDQSRDGSMIDP